MEEKEARKLEEVMEENGPGQEDHSQPQAKRLKTLEARSDGFPSETEALKARLREMEQKFMRVEQENETIKQENETIKEKFMKVEQENETIKQENETIKENTGYARFLERKFPPLVKGHGSSKSHVTLTTHGAATLAIARFQDVPRTELAGIKGGVPSTLKILKSDSGGLFYDNESMIATFVELILNEASVWTGLQSSLRISSQYYLSAVRPDLVFIMGRELGIPVGVVEVKLPDRDHSSTAAMEAGPFHGQLFDYLMTLRHLYGVQHPFGIATTYQHWRVCWLPDSDGAAQEHTPLERTRHPAPLHAPANFDLASIPVILPKPKRALKADQAVPAPVKAGEDSGAGSQGEAEDEEDEEDHHQDAAGEAAPQEPPLPGAGAGAVAATGSAERKLHGTPILAYNDEDLPLRIVSVLIKMGAAACMPRKPSLDTIHPLVTPQGLTWCTLPQLPVNPPTFPNGNTSNFYLLEELGHGLEGRVYRACSASGATCALKVFKDPHFTGEGEIETWRKVWRLPAYCTPLLERTAMVMPLVLTVDLPEGEQDRDQLPRAIRDHPVLAKATEEALLHLDNKGQRHDDLHWRHVGFYRNGDGGEIKAVLIDCKMMPKTDTSLREMQQQLLLH